MDQITSSLMREFAKEHDLQGMEESKQFEHFASYVVIRKEYPTAFDTTNVVTGDGNSNSDSETNDQKSGGSDAGIDGVGILVNGVLIGDVDELEDLQDAAYWDVSFLLIQAETSTGFDQGKLLKFGTGLFDFFKSAPEYPRSKKLTELAEIKDAIYDKSNKFSRGNPTCKFHYVTTGKVNEDDAPMKANTSIIKSRLDDTGLFRTVVFIPIGANGVQSLYFSTKHGAKTEFVLDKKATLDQLPGIIQAYMGFLPWSEYKKIVVGPSGALNTGLFFDNIRAWQGYNEVNDGIKSTLTSNEERSRFALMNNGVTIIAKELRPTGSSFYMEDYQIVNGCQTTHVLYDHRDLIPDDLWIPVRIIHTRDEGVTTSITKATNRQTRVKPEQLFALEEFPKQLERFFDSYEGHPDRIFFERRDNQYPSGSGVAPSRVITFADMIRAFAAMFLNEPHRTTRNFSGLKQKMGKDIFVKNQKMDLYYAAALCLKRIDQALKNGKLRRELAPAKYHLVLAMRIIIAGRELPNFKAKKAIHYSKEITGALLAPIECESSLWAAASLVERAAEVRKQKEGDDRPVLHRDRIRTEPFTDEVARLSGEWYDEHE